MIRRAATTEAQAVKDLVERSFAHYVPRIGRRPGPMDEDYAARIAAGEVYLAGEPIEGVAVLRRQPDHLVIDVVAVEPAAQGKGLGRRLVGFAEETAKRFGAAEVRLFTHELMHENIALYARLGYEIYESRKEPGFTRVFLRKRLVAQAPG